MLRFGTDDDPSEDWTLRHGCSVTLSVALKQAPERILTEEWRERVVKTLVKYMTADRVGGQPRTSRCAHGPHLVSDPETTFVIWPTGVRNRRLALVRHGAGIGFCLPWLAPS